MLELNSARRANGAESTEHSVREESWAGLLANEGGEPQISNFLGDCQCMGITLRIAVYCRVNSAKRLFTIFKRRRHSGFLHRVNRIPNQRAFRALFPRLVPVLLLRSFVMVI
jgi:hypothetical protein